MTATITTAIPRADLDRLLTRLAELHDLDRLMREPGTLPAPHTPAVAQLTPRRTP
jgi:hypothetical protein